MNDSEKQLCGYMSIVDMLIRMKDTSLIEDPMVIAQLKELRVAMAELNAMTDRLQQAVDLHKAATRRSPPRLYVVKRSPDTSSGISK
ncbi:hypothetical protein [Pseudomonas syringae pv. coryli]|uniref:hypothetical protein n=1 Tax=Pseudomonas syringae pv. coryli TaxID=317659 RepID=UPI000A8455CA|nr:hypothetical protein [Pseudomonas syringae pv. coryli]